MFGHSISTCTFFLRTCLLLSLISSLVIGHHRSADLFTYSRNSLSHIDTRHSFRAPIQPVPSVRYTGVVPRVLSTFSAWLRTRLPISRKTFRHIITITFYCRRVTYYASDAETTVTDPNVLKKTFNSYHNIIIIFQSVHYRVAAATAAAPTRRVYKPLTLVVTVFRSVQ